MAVLSVTRLSKSYGGVRALDAVSFTVARGELVAMIGPNGAGKTTCFNLLNGQLEADAGEIVLEGRRLSGLAPRQIWRLGVGRTFQVTQTFGSMSVRENVQVALLSHHRKIRSLFSSAAKLFPREAEALLERVGMLDQAERSCAVLAYGDLKRVELASPLIPRHSAAGLPRPPDCGSAGGCCGWSDGTDRPKSTIATPNAARIPISLADKGGSSSVHRCRRAAASFPAAHR